MWLIEIIVVLLLILLNGFFAMSELAVVNSRHGRLEQLAEEGHKGARAALALADDPKRFLAGVQIGVTFTAIVTGTFSGATLAKSLGELLNNYSILTPYTQPVAIGIVVVAVTYLTLVIGELVPKHVALKDPEAIASRVARPLVLLTKAVSPLVSFLSGSTDFIVNLMGLRPGFERPVTEEEIHDLIEQGEKSGAIHTSERDMIEGVLDLEDRAVRTIMTPRPDVVWIDLEESKDAILRKLRECHHAQVLVSRGSIDEIAGVVRKQDLLDQHLANKGLDVESAILKPLIVHEGASILRTLDLFRKTPVHTAVIVDEYGSIQGIVTRTDLLEVLAGDLPNIGAEPEPKVERRDDGAFLIDATIPISEVAELLGLDDLPQGDYLTLAGFVLSQLQHVAQADALFTWGQWRFQIAGMDGHRIEKILVRPLSGPKEEEA
ncbi:MAG: hemolysin family protein [Candidatus Binataceae bacterium]